MRLDFELDSHGNPIGRPVTEGQVPHPPDRALHLQGAYVRLEPLEPRHAGDLWTAFSADAEGRLWTYLPAGPFADAAAFTAWLDHLCTLESLFPYAIVDRATGEAIGFASYLRVDPDNRSIEVGWIGYSPRLQRSRHATDTMFIMMREAFAMGYRRYEWKCNALNAPSIAAAHRLGFTFEGLFRQATLVKGRNRDTAWFSIIDGDWPILRAAFERWLDPSNFDVDGRQRERLSDLTAPVVRAQWPRLDVAR